MTEQALIGLIGGMSWESSAQYYRLINEAARERLGGVASARTLMWSFDFAEIERLQHAGQWPELSRRLADAARQAVQFADSDRLLADAYEETWPSLRVPYGVPVASWSNNPAPKTRVTKSEPAIAVRAQGDEATQFDTRETRESPGFSGIDRFSAGG